MHMRSKYHGKDIVGTGHCDQRVGCWSVAQLRLVEEEKNEGH